MNGFIQGVGAVSPVGSSATDTWSALVQGRKGERKMFPESIAGRSHWFCPVPAKFFSEAARQPRLRRSGTISMLATTAGYDAIAEAGLKPETLRNEQIAIVCAVSSGSVTQTKRFFSELVTQGARSASPMLFPETVYNAPASHLAALLGLDGQNYTLVGDSSVGASALHFATELLAIQPELDRCLVVAAEESDWLLADGFATWRMTTEQADFEVYGRNSGTVLGEGGAAILVGRQGPIRIDRSSPGESFFSMKDGASAALAILSGTGATPDLIVGSANGTFVDRIEQRAFERLFPTTPVYCPKPAIGDALGASALLQIVIAAFALRHHRIPGTLSGGPNLKTLVRETIHYPVSTALVSCMGFNQQVNAVLLDAKGY
ncbi:MAG: hypothetical protein JO076_06025 [Verrucomicrobia bacterium]|nr:hypothetical protein [Verrucomicrobiota bacterium]